MIDIIEIWWIGDFVIIGNGFWKCLLWVVVSILFVGDVGFLRSECLFNIEIVCGGLCF